MKLVAKQDFANVPALGLKLTPKTDGFKHENIVHKGHRFSIGAQEFYKDLNSTDQEIVGTLIKHGHACFDNKENAENGVIETIEKELAYEAKAAANAKASAEANKPVTMAEVLAAITKVLETKLAPAK